MPIEAAKKHTSFEELDRMFPRYILLAQSLRDHAIILLDTEGRVATWDPSAERILGYRAEEILGKSGAAFLPPDPQRNEFFVHELQTAETSGEAVDENWMIGKGGRRFWAAGATTPLRDDEGMLRGYAKIFRDLSERRVAEEALRENELRLRVALAAGRMGTWHMDLRTNKHSLDDSLHRLMGIPEGKLIDSLDDFLQWVHEDDRQRVQEAFEISMDRKVDLSVEFRVVRNDGRVIWLRDQGDIVAGSDGDAHYLTGACMDISGQKAAESALRASEEQFRRAIEEAPIPVIMQAEDGKVLQISRTWTELTGFRLTDLTHMDAWLGRTYGKGAAALRDHFQALFKGNRRSVNVELILRTRHGAVRHWSFSASSPGTLADGRRFIVGMAVDVTEQKCAEHAMRESEARLKRAAEIDTVGILFFDDDAHVNEANDAFLRMTGFTRDQLKSGDLHLLNLTTPEWRTESMRALEEYRSADRIVPFEKEYLRPDGGRWWGLFAATRIGDNEGVAYVIDVSERRRAAEELRRSREELEERVQERTAELDAVNGALRDEILERKRLDDARLELRRQLVTAQEDERRRISRELHDEIGQHLTALMLGLKALESGAYPLPVPAGLRLLQSLTERIGQEVHELALELRPTALDDLGLLRAISNYVEDWSRRTAIQADFHSSGLEEKRLSSAIETTIYRIVQEALNNVLKHSRARHVSVIIERKADRVSAIVEDDGQGFDLDQMDRRESNKRIGLLGMGERAELVDGEFRIESSKDQGTTIFVSIPLKQHP